MPPRASTQSLLRGLVLACHPLPTVAVTAFATAFAAAVGLPAGRVALAALVACAGASLTLGIRAAAAHALTVLGGWAYDLWLKPNAASFLPYAVAFGALPAVATLAAATPRLPEPGVI